MTTHDPKLLHKGVLAVRRNTIRRLLHTVFGIEQLRDGQQRVIDSVLDGKDTLAIMPTGSGKSLCYQIPARILDGMTVVVSPLISLMKDQLEKLDELGIRAVQVNSSLSCGGGAPGAGRHRRKPLRDRVLHARAPGDAGIRRRAQGSARSPWW